MTGCVAGVAAIGVLDPLPELAALMLGVVCVDVEPADPTIAPGFELMLIPGSPPHAVNAALVPNAVISANTCFGEPTNDRLRSIILGLHNAAAHAEASQRTDESVRVAVR
jgi:hypothetical protein